MIEIISYIIIFLIVALFLFLFNSGEKTETFNNSDVDYYELLDGFKRDAQHLYRYGGLAYSDKRYFALENNDRERLLKLAMNSGDNDIINVARYLSRR